MKTPGFTFTIVTPSYNQGSFIEQTVKSVLNQKVQVKYLVNDGGSTDQTKSILKKYGTQLEWQSKSDKGQTDAINKGRDRFVKDKDCSSKIFAYINSDDYYLPGALKKVSQAFASNPDKMWLVGDAVIIDEQGKEIQRWIRVYKRLLRSFLSKWLLIITNPIPQPAVFIRLKAVKELGKFDQALHYTMDYDYWLRLYHKFGRPILLDKPLATFRIHSSAKGEMGFEKQFEEQLLVSKRHSSNQVLLGLQKLHNALIVGVYKLIK